MELMVKVTLILAAAALAPLLLRRQSAALRHAVWLVALIAAMLAPLAPEPGRGHEIGLQVPVEVRGAPEPVAAPAPEPEPIRIPLFPMLWAAGSLTVAARLVAGLIGVNRISRRAAADGFWKGIPVAISPDVAIPFTWGAVRPVIVLPDAARHWDSARRHLVLTHEAIHVARRDWLAHLAGRAACIVYWFHPLAWYAAGQMRMERERACDDAVLRSGVAAVDYAGHLLELTRGTAGRLFPGVAMEVENELEARMRFLLDLKRNRAAVSRAGAIGVLTAAAVLLTPLALLKVRAQAGGGLRGVVQDPSGARVPEAILLLKKTDGQEIAYSGADGAYVFASVPAGDYTLAVMSRGFARVEKEVKVEAGSVASLDVTLPMGRIQETVEVLGSKPRAAMPATAGAPQRIRVGGNVQASRLLVQEKPVYPQELQDQGIEGTVLLDAVIGVDGALLSLRPANTMVHAGLVKAATDAVSRWRYQPTLLNGQPVEIITAVTVRFRLPSR